MSFDLLLQNGTLVLPWGEVQADIGVRAGHIVAIGKNLGAGREVSVTAGWAALRVLKICAPAL